MTMEVFWTSQLISYAWLQAAIIAMSGLVSEWVWRVERVGCLLALRLASNDRRLSDASDVIDMCRFLANGLAKVGLELIQHHNKPNSLQSRINKDSWSFATWNPTMGDYKR